MALIVKPSILVMMIWALLVLVSCTSSTSSEKSSKEGAAQRCTEPQNPYDEGSGHYAGYEWAETNNPATCGGRSDSFVEGCEENQQQESEYEDQKKK